MKVIFLDFDGVLNNRKWLSQNQHQRDEVDPERVRMLNWLVAATGANVVISSTWRILHTIDELRGTLDRAGFVGDVIDITPGGGGVRGHQIQAWIDHQEFNGPFVILDDDSDMEHLLHKLIQTNFEVGLQPVHVKKAIAMLNGTSST